jgi:hypothetical protein
MAPDQSLASADHTGRRARRIVVANGAMLSADGGTSMFKRINQRIKLSYLVQLAIFLAAVAVIAFN